MPHSISHPPALEGRTLLDELNHRIRNELASVINLVTFKAVWTDNVDAKEELSNVVDLLHQHVEVHNILTMPDRDELVDAGQQLRKLGLATSRCKLDRMNIRLLLSIDTLPLESERCWRLALAVYELVTNAVRHACFDGRDGEIKIKLMRAGSWVNCRVTDNGSGLARIKPGRGLRIVGDLAKSLGGRMGRTFGATSTSFVLDFPLTQREQHANRAFVARRPRTGRRCEDDASATFPASRGRTGKSPHRAATALDPKDIHNVTKNSLTLSASVLLGAVIAAPNAALAQFGLPPGPPPMLAGPPPLGAGGPPPRSRRRRPSLGGPSAGPVAGLPPRAGAGTPPARSRVVRLVSRVLANCMVSSVAAKPIFAVSRVAPRPIAPAATLEIAMAAMAVATGTGPMLRRLQLMPMADLMPPPTMVATTRPHTGDTAPDAFLSVMETD